MAKTRRDTMRKAMLEPAPRGPVAIWDGEPRRASAEHDSVHDQPQEVIPSAQRRPD